jgi:hypothetical protein
MKNLFKILFLIAVTALVTYYLTRKNFVDTEIIKEVKWDTLYRDTGSVKWRTPKPEIAYRDTGSTDTVTIPPDSLQIVQKYLKLHKKFYAKNIYNDTVKNDTNALIVIQDTVHMNQLQQRNLEYRDRSPRIIKRVETRQCLVSKTKLFIGAHAGNNTFTPALMLQTKNDINITAGYDLIGNDAGPRFGLYYSIDFNIW